MSLQGSPLLEMTFEASFDCHVVLSNLYNILMYDCATLTVSNSL